MTKVSCWFCSAGLTIWVIINRHYLSHFEHSRLVWMEGRLFPGWCRIWWLRTRTADPGSRSVRKSLSGRRSKPQPPTSCACCLCLLETSADEDSECYDYVTGKVEKSGYLDNLPNKKWWSLHWLSLFSWIFRLKSIFKYLKERKSEKFYKNILGNWYFGLFFFLLTIIYN